jgi:site-specific recombinase XerD
VILSSGARITEALSLTRSAVVDDHALCIVKGGSEHELVFSAKAQAALADYLRARTDGVAALFVSGDEKRRLSYKEAQRGWNQLCRELGIARFTSHRIRHSCATELLRKHVDSLVITKHIGWRNPATIAGYTEVDLASRREAMQALDGRLAS